MAHLGYQHIISTAPYLSNFDGRTTEYTLETFWSISTHCKLGTNKIWKQNAHFSQLYWINKVIGIAKPSAKIYITIFHCAGHPLGNHPRHTPAPQFRRVRTGEPGHLCGDCVGEGTARAALAYSPRPPALAAAGAGHLHQEGRHIRPHGVFAHPTRLVSKQFFILSPHSRKSSEFWPNNAVPCEFWQSTICLFMIPKGNPAPIVLRSGLQLTTPNCVQQTKQ